MEIIVALMVPLGSLGAVVLFLRWFGRYAQKKGTDLSPLINTAPLDPTQHSDVSLEQTGLQS